MTVDKNIMEFEKNDFLALGGVQTLFKGQSRQFICDVSKGEVSNQI
jgi:hypothetical protein